MPFHDKTQVKEVMGSELLYQCGVPLMGNGNLLW